MKKYDIDNGDIDIKTKDFKSYKLSCQTTLKKQNILLENNKTVKHFHINAIINDKGLTGKINGNIELNASDKIDILTKDISFDLRGIDAKKESNITKPLRLEAFNATVYLRGGLTIPTEEFTFFANEDKKIFSSIYKDNHIFYSKDSNGIDISTNFITYRYLNGLINHTLFHGGSFKLSIKGKDDVFKGKCDIINSVIKSVDKNGKDFNIDIGKFDFYYTNDILTLKNIVLKNSFSTLEGNGYIDLKSKKLNITFKVTILKQLGKTINAIPFLGYILLGQNGKFTSKAKIYGTFDNPIIKTDFAQNVIKSPFNIIFRIIKTPFRLFINPSK
ncbi:MAG: hypothetical protein GXO12_06290 [Epsilonproteobacteria bacterium]|nr:hypothetical protein [Campylobacterota bacterium]